MRNATYQESEEASTHMYEIMQSHEVVVAEEAEKEQAIDGRKEALANFHQEQNRNQNSLSLSQTFSAAKIVNTNIGIDAMPQTDNISSIKSKHIRITDDLSGQLMQMYLSNNNRRVRDHCHRTGNYPGAACSKCNIFFSNMYLQVLS